MRPKSASILSVLLAVLLCASSGVAQKAGDPTPGVDQGSESVPDPQNPGASAGADSPDPDTIEDKLVFALSGYHHFPTRSELDELGPAERISKMLRRFATDSDRRPMIRLRAVDALRYYDDPDTLAFLEGLIEAPDDDLEPSEARVASLMRHHAITSYARIEREDALDRLGELLDADDLQIRLTAISALGKHGGKPAKRRLQKMRQHTDDPTVLRELRKHLD